MPSITIRNLTKQYNGEDGQAVTALDHIDLHIKDGEFVCIVASPAAARAPCWKLWQDCWKKAAARCCWMTNR